jgi:hypothetical protein
MFSNAKRLRSLRPMKLDAVKAVADSIFASGVERNRLTREENTCKPVVYIDEN